MSFRHILVPLDFSEENTVSVNAAKRIAALDEKVKVSMLHVIETIRDVPFEELKVFYDRLENSAREKIGDLARVLEAAGIPVVCDIVYGKRADEILGYAEDGGVDLIVLSSRDLQTQHDRGGIPRTGTISFKVAMLAKCPVLLMR